MLKKIKKKIKKKEKKKETSADEKVPSEPDCSYSHKQNTFSNDPKETRKHRRSLSSYPMTQLEPEFAEKKKE